MTLTVTVPKAALGPVAMGDLDAAATAGMSLDGDAQVLQQVLGVRQPGDYTFNIIEPLNAAQTRVMAGTM